MLGARDPLTFDVWHSPSPCFPTDNPANEPVSRGSAYGPRTFLLWMGHHYCHHCKIGNVSGGADTRQCELIPATACALSHQPTITYHTSVSQMFPCLVIVNVKAQILGRTIKVIMLTDTLSCTLIYMLWMSLVNVSVKYIESEIYKYISLEAG